MGALLIGQSYIDVRCLADELPTGDEKAVARDYAVSFGGNAVSAAFCCAKLGIAPDLLTSQADDWLRRTVLGSWPQSARILAFLRDAAPWAARNPALPRRSLSPSGSAAGCFGRPRAAS